MGAEVSLEEGYEAARLTALSILASLKRALGDLDRVTAWLRVFGMVNSAPDFTQQPAVINGFSDLILELYGTEIGQHARSAVGMAALPFGLPVEIEAEIEIRRKEQSEEDTMEKQVKGERGSEGYPADRQSGRSSDRSTRSSGIMLDNSLYA